ncbi:SphA family protein [Rhizobium skierniewicense]|uniref:SphA family protein n=1 Tax=Rhizobium skierniewicense TaxID=984260 RepID=UPI001572BC64|nr:transporter [Rhizobium skierniewicense]NTF34231.1 hypothetical protein [Rhizobium skierniewicense]
MSYSLVAGCLALGLGVGDGHAAEAFQQTLPGATRDIRAAELPPQPGFYLLGNYTHVSSDAVVDNEGGAFFPDTDQKLDVGNLGFLYVFPGTFWDGRLAVDVIGGYGRNQLTITDLPVGAGGAPIKGDNSGLFDVTGNVTWSRSYQEPPDPSLAPFGLPTGFAYALNLALTLPIGSYDGDAVGNTGFGAATLSPGIAFTYRTVPLLLDATEFSAHVSYNHVFEHSGSAGGFDYRDGDYVIADFAVTERWKMAQFGLAGSYVRQVEDDEGSLAIPTGSRGRVGSLKIGPIISFDLAEGAGVRLKYLFNVEAKNTYEADTLMVSFFKKF